jgi:hypothetical protein
VNSEPIPKFLCIKRAFRELRKEFEINRAEEDFRGHKSERDLLNAICARWYAHQWDLQV